MKKKSLIVPMTLGLALSLAACSQPAGEAASQTAGQADTDDELTGLWQMTSLEVGTDGDLQEVPYSGQIAFTTDTMSVQAMNPDTEAADTEFTLGGYEAYYGDATIDAEAGTFAVEVESAAARDLIGQTLERRFEVTDDTLVITPVDPADGFRATYERHGG
ncbi:lipocalin-like domain-containing protein [Isoptericola hypogeus]|uniref:Lipocalin-like domain-containing protein n=1 Tax=Isoptericola hypogeus TaxID=300179 RepID=A0ABN2JWY8_9MICO